MFFGKKKQENTDYNKVLSDVITQTAILLYRDVGPADVSATVTATIELDEMHRVATMKNVLVEGLPKAPSFEAITDINENLKPLNDMPEEFKLKGLEVEVKAGGAVHCNPIYLVD